MSVKKNSDFRLTERQTATVAENGAVFETPTSKPSVKLKSALGTTQGQQYDFVD